MKEAYDLRHPILIVHALTIWLNVQVGRLLDQRLEATDRRAPYVAPNRIKTAIQQRLDEALELCKLSGSVERRLALNKIESEVLEIQGDLAAARALAEKFYPEAQAMGFEAVAERASEILENRTFLMRYEQERRASELEDADAGRANVTDEQLARITHLLQEIVGSPPAHPKKLLGYMRSLRTIAQQRCEWCRHVQILEDLTETTDPRKAFSTTPMRKCLCARFGYESTGASVDVVAVISNFKFDYCRFCTARSPKGYQRK